MEKITQNKLKERLDYDKNTGIFRRKTSEGAKLIGSIAGGETTYGYIRIKIERQEYQAHCLAWLYIHGELPEFPKYQIDHINHNRSDNRIKNLRVVSRLENQKNLSLFKKNKSGVAGVHWCKEDKVWIARVQVNGGRKALGCFKNLIDAKKAREIAKFKYEFHTNHA